jgi:hypothetical protein
MNPRFLIVVAAALAAGGTLAGEALAKSSKTRTERTPSATTPIQGFDGAWTFEATTTVGACPALVPSAVIIRDNRIAGAAGAAGSDAHWGYVEGDGTFVARFTDQGGHMARANGQLRDGAGSGAWSSSTDLCGGAWRAVRSGAERAGR